MTLGSASSFDEWKASAIFQPFSNFLMLSWSLSELHTCSQIILPSINLVRRILHALFKKSG
jgi:hypothetical protein